MTTRRRRPRADRHHPAQRRKHDDRQGHRRGGSGSSSPPTPTTSRCDLPRRVAAGDTVVFTLAYHTHPERGIYFVPRRARDLVAGRGDRDPGLGADLRLRQRQDDVGIPRHRRLRPQGALQRHACFGDAHGWRQGRTSGTGSRTRRRRRISTPSWSGPFTILHDQWRGKPVDEYVYPDTVDAGWRAAGETPSMIELYSRLTGVPSRGTSTISRGFRTSPTAAWRTSPPPRRPISPPGRRQRSVGRAAEPGGARAGAPVVRRPRDHRQLGQHLAQRGLATYMESVREREDPRLGRGPARVVSAAAAGDGRRPRQPRPVVWGDARSTTRWRSSSAATSIRRARRWRTSCAACSATTPSGPGMHRFLVDNAHKPVTTAGLRRRHGEDLQLRPRLVLRPVGLRRRLSAGRRDPPVGSPATKTLQVTVRADAADRLGPPPVPVPHHDPRDHRRFGGARQRHGAGRQSQTFAMRAAGRRRFRSGSTREAGCSGTVHTDRRRKSWRRWRSTTSTLRARNWALYALAESRTPRPSRRADSSC